MEECAFTLGRNTKVIPLVIVLETCSADSWVMNPAGHVESNFQEIFGYAALKKIVDDPSLNRPILVSPEGFDKGL